MEYKSLRPGFLVLLLILCLEFCEASDRRFINQLNGFKREVRSDLGFIHTDIDTLFKMVKDIKTEIEPYRQTHSHKNTLNDTEKSIEKCSNGKDEMARECAQAKVALLNAFESEKLLNRKLLIRLQAVENAISGMVKNMETFQLLMEYINETLKEKEANRAIEKDEHEIINGDGDEETGTTSTVATTTDSDVKTIGQFCANTKGIHGIYLESLGLEKTIYCDADTDGGGWIVIMRRQDGSVDFDRKWKDYKNGFGNVEGEFWIGNDVLHELTKSKSMELRVDMEDFAGNKAFAKYKRFQVGSEAEKYVLTVTGYSGTAGDSLHIVEHSGGVHNGMKFSTIDSDNDKYDGTNCARSYPGGWWFNRCFRSHLTGKYGETVTGSYEGIIWYAWLEWSDYVKFVEMKIR